jgi:hypothetical protein
MELTLRLLITYKNRSTGLLTSGENGHGTDDNMISSPSV